ncbi:MAG TPA: hypothetical protein VFC39_21810 [Acidobacteriaceae bacterium]|nr:hypothetical protein [Acidobacteriaceae bacterium]
MPSKRAQDGPVAKLMYSREDVSYALSLSLSTIDKLIANRILQPRRFGRRVLIPAAQVKRVADTIATSDMLDGVASTPADRRQRGTLEFPCPTPSPNQRKSAASTKTRRAAESGGASTSPRSATASA